MSSRRNPPPIPRKDIPANIQRARDEIKARERAIQNQERARRMVEIARQNRERRQVLSQGEADRVERLFQSRNELDAIAVAEERDRRRRETALFQARQTPDPQVVLQHQRRIAQRNLERFLQDERLKQGVLNEQLRGRSLGRDATPFANALFGGLGLEQSAEDYRESMSARRLRDSVKHTSLRPLPEPEPEPEPEPMGVGVGGELVPLPTGEDIGRPRGGDTHGNIYGTQAGGGFKLQTPPRPFLEPQPEPEPNPYISRKRE